ncbi:tetratricopeptide repeat protein [Glycomyces buryatensis]|nr:tetratricopeptide repeat protein [Glycomyces buryatensis]
MEELLIAIATAATGKATEFAMKAGGRRLGRAVRVVKQRFKRGSDFKETKRGDMPVEEFAARIYQECVDDDAFRSALSAAVDRDIDVSRPQFDFHGDVRGNVVQAGSIGTLIVQGPKVPKLQEVERATPDFVNHAQDVETLGAEIEAGGWDEIALVGPPGVGKTSMAGLLAHRFDQQFHDGHIYVDLDGSDVRTELRSALQRMGIDKSVIVDDLKGLRRQFVSITKDMAVLVVVDGAPTREHALMFKPDSPAAQLLVLSLQWPEGRRCLVHPIRDLAAEYAAEYLRKEFPELDDEEIRQHVRGRAWRPSHLERLAGLIANQQRTEGRPVSAESEADQMLEAAYLNLSESAAGRYRLLRALPGAEAEPDLLRSIGDLETEEFQELVDARLVSKKGNRYRVRVRDSDDGAVGADVRAALKPVVHYYLMGAQLADPLIQGVDRLRIAEPLRYVQGPEFLSPSEALQWMDGHRDDLLEAVRIAQQCGWRQEQMALAEAMWPLFSNCPLPETAKRVYATALDGLTDPEHKARMLICLGRTQVDLLEHRESESNLKEAVRLAGDNVDLAAAAMEQLGWLYYRQGRLSEAEETYRRGFKIAERKRTKALMLKLLGIVYRDQERDEEARDCFSRAAKRFGKLADKRNVAIMWLEIAALDLKADPERHLDEVDEAVLNLNEGGWTKPLIDALKRLGAILGGEEGQARIEAAKEIERMYGIES